MFLFKNFDISLKRLKVLIKPVVNSFLLFILCESCIIGCDYFVHRFCTMPTTWLWLTSFLSNKNGNMCYYARKLPIDVMNARNNYFYEIISLCCSYTVSCMWNNKFYVYDHDKKITSQELQSLRDFPLTKNVTTTIYAVYDVEGLENGIYLNYNHIKPFYVKSAIQKGSWKHGGFKKFETKNYEFDIIKTAEAAETLITENKQKKRRRSKSKKRNLKLVNKLN